MSSILAILQPSRPTIADSFYNRAVPGTLTREVVTIVSGSLVVAACAQVAIPLRFTPVPITGQTLGVLLVGMSLGSRRGIVAMMLYLLEGAIGLPVFAGGALGLAKLFGPTAGYLWSYPVAAGLVGWLSQRGWDKNPIPTFGANILGSIVILFMGCGWLSLFVDGLNRAFLLGVTPFLLGDIIKAAAVGALLPIAWKIVRK